MRRLASQSLFALATLAGALASTGAQAQLNNNLDDWTCVGVCGGSLANGDITASPLGGSHGYVTTFGSQATGVSHLDIEASGGGGAKFTQTNGSRYTSPSFNLLAGQSLEAYFNYVSTDGKGFDDYAWARLVNAGNGRTAAWLFTARSTNSNTGNVVPGDALKDADNNSVDFDHEAVIVNYDSFSFNTRNTANGNPIDWAPLGDSNGACWEENAPGCGFTGWLQAVVTPGAGSYRLEVGVVNFGDQLYDSGLAFDFQNLSVTTPVPEPAGWALMAGGLGLLGLRRRRQA